MIYVPSAKYFTSIAIPAPSKQAAEIKSAHYFSSTTEMWSSPTMEPYLSYKGGGTTMLIISVEILTQWGLEAGRQVCITTDNRSNTVYVP